MKKNFLFSLSLIFAALYGQVFGQATCPTTALTAAPVTPTSVTLTWAGVGGTAPNATIQRSTDNFATSTNLATIVASTNSYVDASVTAATTYQYRLFVQDGVGSATCTSISVNVPLQAPINLSVSPVVGSPTSLFIQWVDNSTNESGFDIEQSSDGVNFVYRTSVGAAAGSGSIVSTSIAGLAMGTTYWFRVSAFNTNPPPLGIRSSYSNIASNAVSVSIPNPASNAFVSNITGSSATLNWRDNTSGFANETSSEIARATGGGTNYIVLGFVGRDVNTYIDNSIQPDNIYQYRILPRNTTGFANLYAFSGAFFTPPFAPTELKAISVGLNEVRLQWLDKSQLESSFVVERSLDGFGWSDVGGAVKDHIEFGDTGLAEGTLYYYRVKARNSGGDSPYSNMISVTTLKRVKPEALYNLTAKTISTTQIDLEWGLPIENITNKRVAIEIWRSSDGGAFFDKIATIDPHNFKYSDKAGTPKTKYVYIVHATNFQGKSDPSNRAEATTLGPPFAPSNLTVTPTKDAVATDVLAVKWKDNSDDEWGFTVERSTDKDFKTDIFTANLVPNTEALTSTPIEEGVTYYFRVKASNTYGDSKYSDVVTVATAITAVPNAPYALKASAKATEVALTWGDDSNKEQSFDVERSTDGTTFTKVGTTTRNVVEYLDKTVAEKTKYWYRVRAVNSRGNSGFSNVVEVTTPAKTVLFASPSFDGVSSTDEWVVYPNPTSETVNITLPKSLEKSVGIISIFDKSNKEVSRIILKENQENYKVDLSNLPEGTYTISVKSNNGQLSKRVYKF